MKREGWSVSFLIVGLVAAMLGFGGVPGSASSAARYLSIGAFALAAAIWLTAIARRSGRKPVDPKP